jgi:hypothetical protein
MFVSLFMLTKQTEESMLGKRIRTAVFMLIVAACLSGCSADAFNPALHPARTPYQTQQIDGQDIPAP